MHARHYEPDPVIRRARLIKFFTEVTIIPDREMKLECPEAILIEPAQPFNDYTIRINHRGAVLFDGDTPFASYFIGRTGTRACVLPEYRRQRIGSFLIAAWWNAHPTRLPPDKMPRRTRSGHRAGLRALSLIYPDIPFDEAGTGNRSCP